MRSSVKTELYVTGEKEELLEFRRKSIKSKPIGPEFSLFNEIDFLLDGLLPIPEECSVPIQKWKADNWGVTINPVNTVIQFEFDNELCVSFFTENAAPVIWIKRVSMKFPNLQFTLSYVEENGVFCGNVWIGDGEIQETSGIPIMEDVAGRQVFFDTATSKWTYYDDNSTIDDTTFVPKLINQFKTSFL